MQYNAVDKPKIILTDCDGCLVNWLDHFDNFMAAIGYEIVPGTDSHYSMKIRYGISDIDAISIITAARNKIMYFMVRFKLMIFIFIIPVPYRERFR
jgi:hypothetical protein